MRVIRRTGNCFTWATLIVGMTLCLTATSFAAGYIVIANKSVVESSLTKAELQAIFLGEKAKWDNKKHIKIVVLEGSEVTKEFMQRIVGKTTAQFENHWQKMFFSGRAALPQSATDAAQVTEFVSKHPGAIGFVANGQAGDSVKTISIK